MKKVTKVELLWSESPAFSWGARTFTSVSSANGRLMSLAAYAPRSGYAKTGFRITWEDGSVHEGRYDLHRLGERQENPSGLVDLADHVRHFWRFHAGLAGVWWLKPGQYERLLESMGRMKERCLLFLEEYEL